MMKLIALVSESREEEQTKKYLDIFEKKYGSLFEEIIVVRERKEAEKLSKELADEKFIVVAPLSGGTSSLIIKLGVGKNLVVILTHGRNNSLPSGLKAKAYLEARGVKVRLFHEFNLESFEYLKALRGAEKVAKALKSRKLLLVATDKSFFERYGIKEAGLEKLGISVSFVPLDSAVEKFSSAKPSEKVIAKFSKAEGEVSEEDIKEAARVRSLLEELMEEHKATDLGIRCFPFILKTGVTPCLALSSLIDDNIVAGCEADPMAIATMIIFKALGKPSFIGNIEDVCGDVVVLAHCTVATSLVEKFRLRKHFETGKSVAIEGIFPKARVTLAIFSSDFRKLLVAEGDIISGESFSEEMCRTQLKVKIKGAEKLLEFALGGHLVLAPGSMSEVLKAFGELKGLEVVSL